jgi:hypothetical protein
MRAGFPSAGRRVLAGVVLCAATCGCAPEAAQAPGSTSNDTNAAARRFDLSAPVVTTSDDAENPLTISVHSNGKRFALSLSREIGDRLGSILQTRSGDARRFLRKARSAAALDFEVTADLKVTYAWDTAHGPQVLICRSGAHPQLLMIAANDATELGRQLRAAAAPQPLRVAAHAD